MQQVDDLVAFLTSVMNGDVSALERFSGSPIDVVDAHTSGIAADVDPLAIVTDALAGTDLDPATQAAILEAVSASTTGYGTPDGGYSSEQLANIFAQGINITVEEGDQIHVDNSLYVDGDVKGGIHQANVTDITEADHGAIVADGAEGSNFQTGEGNTQVSDSHIDNLVSGDNNTVASDGSTIGNENVTADYISDSEFGEGNQDRSADLDVKISDSFTNDDVTKETYSDDDVIKTHVDVDDHAYGEPAPEPYEPTPVYDHEEPTYEEAKPVYDEAKPVYEEPKPTYEEPTHEYEPEPTYYEPKPEPEAYEPKPAGYEVSD